MVFNSFSFGLFFAAVFASYLWLQGRWRQQKLLLVGASYLFYSAWNPPLVALLAFSTAVDWWAAHWMVRATAPRQQRLALVVSLVSNLGLLSAFKYGNFFLANFVAVAHVAGIHYQPPAWDIVLPVGISFYTFQTLSFSIDVFRGKIDPRNTSFLNFALFVCFFPQLVAGPIVRAVDFLPQLEKQRPLTWRLFVWGVVLLSLGLFQKTVLADAIFARTADLAFGRIEQLGCLDAWTGALGFAGQIYCDFAGYSTAAIGVAMCFGFTLPDNFWLPYGAIGFSDFWRRWHISLSSWLRDYLYISLGGNRCGPVRTLMNLMLTMLLGGLWHGASWNFVLWGGLHGMFLIVERLWRKGSRGRDGPMLWIFGWGLTQLAVLVAWVPFRCRTFQETAAYLVSMTYAPPFRGGVLSASNMALTLSAAFGLYVFHLLRRQRRLETDLNRLSSTGLGVLVAGLWVAIWLAHPEDRSFIYFQF